MREWEWPDETPQEIDRDEIDAFLRALEERYGRSLDLEERIIAEELFLLNKGRR